MLREIRGLALRKRVWFEALDGVERGIVNLTISVVGSVRSLTLVHALSRILAKLRVAFRGAFVRHVEEYGWGRLMDVVQVSLSWGNAGAVGWRTEGFARLLALNDYHNPVGWRQPSA